MGLPGGLVINLLATLWPSLLKAGSVSKPETWDDHIGPIGMSKTAQFLGHGLAK